MCIGKYPLPFFISQDCRQYCTTEKKSPPTKAKKITLGKNAYNEALIINLALKTFWKSYLV